MLRTPAFLLLLIARSASAQCTMDQVQDQWNGGTSERNLPGYSEWQSFTAGESGALCEVDLLFCNINVPVIGTGTLNVFAGEGTAGTLLATQPVSVNGSATPLNLPFWAQWSLANGPQLEMDSVYTVQFVPTLGGGLPDPYLIQIQLPGSYAGGHCYNLGTQGDLAFRTFASAVATGSAALTGPARSVVFPVPARERVFLRMPATASRLDILDANGALVRSLRPTRELSDIDVQDLRPGVYILRAIGPLGSEHMRFVKE